MIVDPLNIFPEIKERIIENYGEVQVYAVGSRAKGKSKKGGWDFDVAVIHDDENPINPQEITDRIRKLFEGRFDENGRPIKIDFWTVPKIHEHYFIEGTKTRSDAILL